MRLSELYTSIQCEGPNTGRPTQFVRFAGCNMRCPLWPCDTEHAINPAIYINDSAKLTPRELFAQVYDSGNGVKNLCLTGGEPFLQRAAELEEFVDLCAAANLKLEVFTNGSFIFPQWALLRLQFIMDWKLPGSGEAETNVPERVANALHLKRSDHIKFVCADMDDLVFAKEIWEDLTDRGCAAQFWAGAAWGLLAQTDVIDFILSNDLPWNLNVQMHKYIWHPDERKV